MMRTMAASNVMDFGLFSPSVVSSLSQKGIRKTMSKNNNDLQPETIGLRWAALLRQHYGTHMAKNIARDFDCEARTAQSWLAGQAPQLRHFMRAAEILGLAAVLTVLFPDTDIQQKIKLHDDLLELRSRLDSLSCELRGLDHDCTTGKNNRKGGR